MASESNTAFLTLTSNFSGTPKTISVNGDKYRGAIELRKLEDGDITVINELLLNEYLYGVVPLEIGTTNTPFEALKAQAVAARTYALGNSNFTALGFDLTDTTLSQVYGGYDVENLASNNAVEATAADVVTYGGVLARLYYFSSSGGATANSENVWLSPIPYLRSVADPYDRIYRYEYTYSASEIANHLTATERSVGDITKIEIVRVSVSGRVVSMKIYGTLGSTLFTNEACRIFAFPDRLPSQMFTVGTASSYAVKMGDNSLKSVELPGTLVKTSTGIQLINSNSRVLVANDSGGTISLIITTSSNSDFVITGAGHGHGVGMSQYGAMGMAEAGYTYEKILQHYFTGVRIEEAKLY
ncbi:MAG: SpoIID/LytB domain-containing protein [Clostridiales bacterium]|nr:SpoIID/LytB domain-containing protein [Clostridiales bacterium]